MPITTLNTNASLTGKTITVNENADTITGVKTFSATPVVNAGIQFPATQVPNAGANVLDDYEEGTWTPSLLGSGGQSGQVYSAQFGRYIKIGRHVRCQGRITLSTLGTLTTSVQIGGLPFTAEVTANNHGTITMAYFVNLTASVVWLGGYVQFNSTIAPLQRMTAAATGVSSVVQADLSATTDLVFQIEYFASA